MNPAKAGCRKEVARTDERKKLQFGETRIFITTKPRLFVNFCHLCTLLSHLRVGTKE